MSPSNFFDRQARASGAVAGDFGRIIGRGPINTERVPIPHDAIPRRLKSHDIDLEHDRMADEIADVVSRVLAEDRRLRNLLPPAPRGYEWHGELVTHEDFASLRLTARIVYTLREIR